MGSTVEIVFGLCLVRLGWLGHGHGSGCRRTCKHVHQHLPTWVSLSAPVPLPGGVRSPKLQEQRSPVGTDQDSPVPPGLAAAALAKQAGSRPAAFVDPIRHSSSTRFRSEEQFLLSAPWAAPGMLSSCSYCRREQVQRPRQLFPCLLPSSRQRFWTAQLGYGLEQPATQFPWPLVALVPSSATIDGNMAVVALGTGMSLVGSDGERLCSLGQSSPAKVAKAPVVTTGFEGKPLEERNSRDKLHVLG